MIEHGEMILSSLVRMKDMITQQEIHLMDQRMREHGAKGGDFDDDVSIYGENLEKHVFGGTEGKKQRRGVCPNPLLHNTQGSDLY